MFARRYVDNVIGLQQPITLEKPLQPLIAVFVQIEVEIAYFDDIRLDAALDFWLQHVHRVIDIDAVDVFIAQEALDPWRGRILGRQQPLELNDRVAPFYEQHESRSIIC